MADGTVPSSSHIRALRPRLVVREGEADTIGGKGHHLSVLEAHGIDVPPWFAVTVAAFERLAYRDLAEIDRLAETLSPAEEAAVVAELERRIGAPGSIRLARSLVLVSATDG